MRDAKTTCTSLAKGLCAIWPPRKPVRTAEDFLSSRRATGGCGELSKADVYREDRQIQTAGAVSGRWVGYPRKGCYVVARGVLSGLGLLEVLFQRPLEDPIFRDICLNCPGVLLRFPMGKTPLSLPVGGSRICEVQRSGKGTRYCGQGVDSGRAQCGGQPPQGRAGPQMATR